MCGKKFNCFVLVFLTSCETLECIIVKSFVVFLLLSFLPIGVYFMFSGYASLKFLSKFVPGNKDME